MKAEKIMTRDVITVTDRTKVRDLIKILGKHNISGAPVLDENGRLCGIVSEKDVIRARLRAIYHADEHEDLLDLFSPTYSVMEDIQQGKFTRYRWVEQIMTRDVVTVGVETSVEEVASTMLEHHFHRLPVLEKDGGLAGIITTIDMVKLLR